jgi:endoglucanase Acf2
MRTIRLRQRFGLGFLIAMGLGACGPSVPAPRPLAKPPAGPHMKVGDGFVLTSAPAGVVIGANKAEQAIKPKVTADFKGPPPTAKWWEPLLWQFDPNEPHSTEMYAHPLTFRAVAGGIGMGYPDKPTVLKREFMFRHVQDLVVGLSGMASPDTRVASASDWAVTAEWKDKTGRLRATMGHGMPFVYFQRDGSTPAVVHVPDDKAKTLEVWSESGPVMGITVNGHHYALFAPSKATWTKSGNSFTSTLADQSYFSVAVLPDKRPETLDLFKQHAYAFVKDTKVEWSYDEAKAQVTSRFTVTTEQKETGGQTTPLIALYRHQYLHSSDPTLAYQYVSPCGAMKLFAGSSFTTTGKFGGVLPVVPIANGADKGDIKLYVREASWVPDLFPIGMGEHPDKDTYWTGKSLGKHATNLQLADQIGETATRDFLVRSIENELADWFDGEMPKVFVYDKTWNSVVGLPQSYGSAAELNDHHFHYGYFVAAGAAVARFDPAWAKRWAPAIELLAKEGANWDRNDKTFPFLRYSDVYAGHSWANGPSQFKEGNNEESSSEEINLWTAFILWGQMTGNRAMRDAGIFLYTTAVDAIEQYWLDIDKVVFPKGFPNPVVAMVWGAGGKYDTWWDQNPIFIHGINMIPYNGGSFYLGRHPDLVKRNFESVMERSGGNTYIWRDYMMMYAAMFDPKKGMDMWDEENRLDPEFGNSRAQIYAWLTSFAEFGQVDVTVSADLPTYAAFKKGSTRTYFAYNATGKTVTATFSDGQKLSVPPNKIARTTRQIAAAGAKPSKP